MSAAILTESVAYRTTKTNRGIGVGYPPLRRLPYGKGFGLRLQEAALSLRPMSWQTALFGYVLS